MPEPVRLAVVGCGRIAQAAHLPALEKANGIQLVAVADPQDPVHPESLARPSRGPPVVGEPKVAP